MSKRQEAKVVVEDAPAVKEGQGEAKNGLESLLECVYFCALFIGQLLVDVVLSKRKAGEGGFRKRCRGQRKGEQMCVAGYCDSLAKYSHRD